MEALDVLARLTRQQIDRERQALGAVDAAMAHVQAEIERLRQSVADERQAAILGIGDAFLAAYVAASRTRERSLLTRLAALEQARVDQLERLLERRLGLKRLELLAARRAEQRRSALRRSDQQALEDLIQARRGRAGDG